MESSWQEVSQAKQRQRAALLPTDLAELGISSLADIEKCLTETELEITNKAGIELVQMMKQGRVTVRTVLDAFIKRATLAHKLTNCLTEILFEPARHRADQLDRHFQETGEAEGHLYGLPMTVKDSLFIEGYDATVGFIHYCNKPAKTNAVFYDCLMQQNAIVIAKTNVPMSMMAADSVNNVFGRTTNPVNSSFNSGGSSGGEGAVVRCRGSAIGIGTDIAGSIRIPAFCCGTFGFKPATCRLPFANQQSGSRPGNSLIIPCIGPIANDPRDLRLVYEAVLDSEPWRYDISTRKIPFRKIRAPDFIRIGYVKCIGDAVPHPPVQRAMDQTIEALEKCGHTVFEITDFPDVTEMLRSALDTLFSLDSYETTFSIAKMGNEPIVDILKILKYPEYPKRGTEDIIKAQAQLIQIKASVMKCFQKHLGGAFDFLLCPPAPCTALPHDNFTLVDYTMLWNGVDMPATIIPVTEVDPTVDMPRTLDMSQRSDLAKHIEGLYNPVDMKGLPVCVQLVSQAFMEEELLEASAIVASALMVGK